MKKYMIFDATQKGPEAMWLSTFWSGGRFIGNFDLVFAANSWEQAYAWIRSLPPDQVDKVEYWMHGGPAEPLIDGEPPDLHALGAAWGHRLGGVHWFRACDVGKGKRGQRWAEEAAVLLRKVAVHTRIVSQSEPPKVQRGLFKKLRRALAEAWSIVTGVPFQSGCYALRSGETSHWDHKDGGYSGPKKKNTALLTDRWPPPEAWQVSA